MRLLAASMALMLIVGGCSQQPPDTDASSPPAAASLPPAVMPSLVPTEGNRPPVDDLPPAAEPQSAPPQTAPIPGRIVPVGKAPEGVVVDAATRMVAVAKRDPNELVLLNADTGDIAKRVPLPGFVRHLQLAAPGGPVLVPVESANALLRVELPGGRAEPQVLTGTVPHDAAQAPRGAAMGLIDVRKNDLPVYNSDSLTIVGSTPAGAGPTHLVADRHGRMIATDTRGDAVRVFDIQPRQLAEIAQPGGPYGIT